MDPGAHETWSRNRGGRRGGEKVRSLAALRKPFQEALLSPIYRNNAAVMLNAQVDGLFCHNHVVTGDSNTSCSPNRG